MSELKLSLGYKNCATCEYWAGSRHTDSLRKLACFEQGTSGECCGGGMNFSNMPSGGTCGKYKPWSVLK